MTGEVKTQELSSTTLARIADCCTISLCLRSPFPETLGSEVHHLFGCVGPSSGGADFCVMGSFPCHDKVVPRFGLMSHRTSTSSLFAECNGRWSWSSRTMSWQRASDVNDRISPVLELRRNRNKESQL